MEILFKSNTHYFYIEEDILQYRKITFDDVVDLDNIKHLDDAEVLFHYRNIAFGGLYPVYYEYNGICITKSNLDYYCQFVLDIHIKDYTMVNINLL